VRSSSTNYPIYNSAANPDHSMMGAAMGFFKSVVGFWLFLMANRVAGWLNQETVL
jgi:ABC-type polysaccharide transport system permease subunit